MRLGEGQARKALLDVLLEKFGDPGMAYAPASRQLGSEPQSHFPAWRREYPPQAFGELLAPGVAHHPQEVPRVVDFAPLVGGALEVAG